MQSDIFAVTLRMRVYKRVFHRLIVVTALVVSLVALDQATACQSPWQKNFQAHRRTIKVVSTRLSGFGIPFNIEDESGQFIEVQLYVSRDEGESWSFHSRQPLTAKEFPFDGDGDGEYWFAIKTLDRNRRLLPEGDAVAELKVVVDSSQPELQFQIDSDPAGRIVCRWQARDNALDIESFKIDYRTASGQYNGNAIDEAWSTVPASIPGVARNGAWSDQVAWWPDTSAKLYEVRISIADEAGNEVQASRQVAVAGASWRRTSSSSTLNNPYYKPSTNQIPPQTNQGLSQTTGPPGSLQNADSPQSDWQKTLRPIENTGLPTAPQIADSHQTRKKLTFGQQASHTIPGPGSSATQPPSSPVDPRWRTNQPAPQTQTLPQISNDPNVEFIAPPLPVDWNPADQLAVSQLQLPIAAQTAPKTSRRETASNNPSTDSIPWESEVISRSKDLVDVSSTALRPTGEILPERERIAPRSTDNIPSNPGTTIRSGAKVIGESTTSWPNNQWNGPTEPIQNPNTELAPSASRRQIAETIQPIQFRPLPPQPLQPQPPANEPPSRFSSAGFAKPSQPQQDSGSRGGFGMPDSANTQIIGTKRFELNYDVNAIDPSGVGQVDLWVTRDRGRSWTLWGYDPDHASPFPVEVVDEGLYGFRIVVRSKDGLAGRGPSRGDQPDMWVLIDVTSPQVRISSVPYGRETEAGNLVINYAISDANLTLRPVELSWSTNPDGPWTTIAKDLRNDGRHLWKPNQNVPERVFLRAAALDRAGNIGVHNLSQTIDISGLVPRGTIFGVVPVGK